MILREISDTSIITSLFRYFFRWHSQFGQRINTIYHNSQIFRLAKGSWTRIKISFRYSFLGRITETRQISSGVLDNSKLIQYLFNSYKKWKHKVIQLPQFSSTADLAKDTKKALYSFPVRIISIIVIIAITINVIFSFVIQKEISLWGWLMRGLFLVAAVIGLFCKADWQTIKKNSVFLRKVVHQQVQKNHI